MKSTFLFIGILFVLFVPIACQQSDSESAENDNGFLMIPAVSLDIDIEQGDFLRTPGENGQSSSRRTTGSDINDFVVEILSYPGLDVFISWENYSEVLALGVVELPAGTYILRAYNDDFPSQSPTFDFPYFFTESPVFVIEYEETTVLGDLIVTAKNTRTSVNFSSNVGNFFDNYSMDITTSENGGTLLFDETETRSGYFSSGYDLSLSGNFSYTRIDGTTETRTISHTIENIQEATHYIITVDVTLENGELIFNLILDDSFTIEEINLGNGDLTTPFQPNPEPVITSPLNTFEDETTNTYNLTWVSIPEATHYDVYTGSSKFNLSPFVTNLTATSTTINLLEGANFFRVDAHFPDGSTTSYLGGNFRKLTNINTEEVVSEITPVNELIYNYQNSEVNGSNVSFQATASSNVVITNSIKVHINGSSSGQFVTVSGGFINEEIDVQDGGMGYYNYSGVLTTGNAGRVDDTNQYYVAVTDPDDSFGLAQEFSPLAVRINLNNHDWSIGTPYYHIEKREAGTSTWEILGTVWSTSSEVFDYDVTSGTTYEYRFKVSAHDNFTDDSQFSQIQSITVN